MTWDVILLLIVAVAWLPCGFYAFTKFYDLEYHGMLDGWEVWVIPGIVCTLLGPVAFIFLALEIYGQDKP